MTEPDDEDKPMYRTYAAVLALQFFFLLALWAAGRYFGSN